jgi:hypothetical protein
LRLQISFGKFLEMDLSEVWRAANELIEMFGDDAGVRAAMRADASLDVGDTEDYRFWKPVTVAINDLNRTPAQSETKN